MNLAFIGPNIFLNPKFVGPLIFLTQHFFGHQMPLRMEFDSGVVPTCFFVSLSVRYWMEGKDSVCLTNKLK